MENKWSGFYQAGGIAAYILIVYSMATMVGVLTLGVSPLTARECFLAMQENKLVTVLRLDLLTVLFIPLYYLLFGSIFITLRKTNEVWSVVSVVLVFAGVTLFLATPSVFSMMTLSDKYVQAVTDEEKNLLLAAGEAILASDMWHGTGAFMGGLFVQAGALIFCLVMLKSDVYSRLTAWLGMIMFGLDLLHIISGVFFPKAGVLFMAIAGPIYFIWFFLVGKRLIRLGSE